MPEAPRTAVVLGASPDRSRISNEAVRRLTAAGWRVVPVHPTANEVEGRPAVRSIAEVAGPVELLTVYVRPAIGEGLVPAIAALAPRRVVLNPGSESPRLVSLLAGAGLKAEEACTLVLLATGKL